MYYEFPFTGKKHRSGKKEKQPEKRVISKIAGNDVENTCFKIRDLQNRSPLSFKFSIRATNPTTLTGKGAIRNGVVKYTYGEL
ncbi:hypothetical protein ED312_01210 [Sinomicrobium pectinilyticum]|uniref:Uncharacterized protein n=1 Tax=Sinomicrobium pectinilyticum TaxID=1084421 RepID=A0A3N0F596_SINP1|nr:hypothetical protein [Sinomicrobium pectinilyticum]RNL95241.1 hypothetical protein ED312_01210 [Sinomicrobium pectinilyticum]